MLRFPLVVGVVFIHAYESQVGFAQASLGVADPGFIAQFVRELVSQGLARISVPLFFMMSGYLFFLGFEWSWANFGQKLRHRARTLLIPFLFWNLFTLLLFALAQSLPATRIYFSGQNAPIASYGAFDFVNAIFGLTYFPIATQFWFIRDLMIMVLLAPLLRLALKYIPRLFLGLVAALWFFHAWPVYLPTPLSFLFFYVGALLAFWGRDLFELDRHGKLFLVVYAALLLLDAGTKGQWFNGYLHRAGILFGLASVLYASKLALNLQWLRSFLLWAAGCSFFVFAAHLLIQIVLRKISYLLLRPESDAMILALYFLIPLTVVAVSILLHVILKAIAPRLLNVIAGGR